MPARLSNADKPEDSRVPVSQPLVGDIRQKRCAAAACLAMGFLRSTWMATLSCRTFKVVGLHLPFLGGTSPRQKSTDNLNLALQTVKSWGLKLHRAKKAQFLWQIYTLAL